MYVPEFFTLEEFFPKQFLYKYRPQYGDYLWAIFPFELLWTQDRLREMYGQMIMNDWAFGGTNEYRGFRPFNCEVGAALSMHKFGLACDAVFIDTDVEQVRSDILADPWRWEFKHIRCLEQGVSWLHWDFRNHLKQGEGIKLI